MNQENTAASVTPVDHLVTTKHSAVIRGQALDYVATTGTMVVETAGKKCEIFFTWGFSDRAALHATTTGRRHSFLL